MEPPTASPCASRRPIVAPLSTCTWMFCRVRRASAGVGARTATVTATLLPCCAPPPPENPGEMVSAGDVQAVITQQRASVSGYDTYRVAVSFDSSVVQDVYALYGDLRGSGSPLIFPPAWQAPSPFGSNVGPVNPALYAAMPDAEYDSFLTIGIDGPATQSGALSSVGIDFEAWTERDGITANDGGEFSDTAASLEKIAHFV